MIDVYKPEIAELLVLVEKAYPKSLHTSTDFDEFSLHLKREMNESVSTSTYAIFRPETPLAGAALA